MVLPSRSARRIAVKTVDLFSGAGGLSLGFHQAGFRARFAVEREQDFARTFAANFGVPVETRPIEEVVADRTIDFRADVVIGGPPCQGFSNLTGNKPSDPRRALWAYYMDVVERSGCKVFLVENVPNLLTSPEGAALISHARSLGFHVDSRVLLASEFGVPQNRRRAFILGSRLGPIALPRGSGLRRTVRDAFKGIPLKPLHRELLGEPASGSDLHIGRNPQATSLARYRAVPEGGNRFDLFRNAPELTPDCWKRKKSGGTDLFGRLEWDAPARCTIRTEFYKPEKGRYLHPTEDRPITHWEASRLQGFPDTFKWFGTKIRIAVQIGNAVPPPLARAIADTIRAHLASHGRMTRDASGRRDMAAGTGNSRRSARSARK